jgi:hypothetical protein
VIKMVIVKQLRGQLCIALLGLLVLSVPTQAAHRVLLFNQNAMDKVLEMWPDYVESVNNQARGMENAGARGAINQAPLRAHLGQLLREQPTPAQFGDGFKKLMKDHFLPAGRTTFGSRVNTNAQVSAYHYMLREDGRFPVRHAFSLDLARQAIPESAAAGFYEHRGAMWNTIEANHWLWLHGMSAEGDWDAPNRACMGDDLAVKAGVEVRQVKEIIEICPDFNAPTVQALMRGVRSGWRFAGVHGNGSHAIRLFVQKLEEHMKANPKVMTLDFVREARHGFAHGTLVGAVPEVVESILKYNLYIPIDAARSMTIEAAGCRQNYVEACIGFMAPIKTLLDQGVKVVGEAEVVETNPETYFNRLDVYVNREVTHVGGHDYGPPDDPKDGSIYNLDEGVDRVVALKLFTHRSSEFLYAETKVGSLEVGKMADFIVSDKPYLSGTDREIRDNKVVMTVLAGKTEYKDPDYKPVTR